MADNSSEARERAEMRLQKAQKAEVVRKQAMSEYEAEAKERAAKSARLKALRLAKEAEDQAAAAAAPPKPSKKRRATKAS